ncbi:MAG: LCP family protein [Chloroflexota bacterium]|nr:LCP family protein [Chloroflexota bacterium]
MSIRQPSARRSKTVPTVVAGVVLLLIAAVVAFFLLRGGKPAAVSSPQPSASAQPTPTLSEALLNRRLTVLVIGTDVNKARAAKSESANTDSLMLVSISAGQKSMLLVSVPRDTVDVPLPGGGVWDQKINAIFIEKGVDALVGAMKELFGVPIDGYVKVDMDDFQSLVDAVGGVDVNPEKALDDPKLGLKLDAGKQHIDAATALKYVRTRVDQDYGRAARQQEVLLALVAKLVDPNTNVDLRKLLDGLKSLETDLPLEDLPTLVEIARRAEHADGTRQVLEPPDFITFEGDRGDGRGYILEPDVEKIRAFVQGKIGK